MNKSNKETNLIKKLLADQLDKKERKKLYYSNLIEKQMRKQWKENREPKHKSSQKNSSFRTMVYCCFCSSCFDCRWTLDAFK